MTPEIAIFLTCRETANPVIESQVLVPAGFLSKRGAESSVFAILPWGSYLRKKLRKTLQTVKDKALDHYGVPYHPTFIPPARNLLLKRLGDKLAIRSLRRHLVRNQNQTLIQARGVDAALIALEAAAREEKVKVIFDCRGDSIAELVGSTGFSFDARAAWPASLKHKVESLTRRESIACESADQIVCVSQVLKRRITERHGTSPDKITVVPCCVDDSRFPTMSRTQAKANLGLAGRFVVLYLGSLEWYQCPDEALRIFSLMQKIRDDVHFLAVTTHPDRMREAAAAAALPPTVITIVTAAVSEVPNTIAAADVAMLLRRESPVNEVAAPVKFAEYLAAGIPVLLTDGIGDYSEMVREYDLGTVIRLYDDDETIYDNIEGWLDDSDNETGARVQECCRKNLSTAALTNAQSSLISLLFE